MEVYFSAWIDLYELIGFLLLFWQYKLYYLEIFSLKNLWLISIYFSAFFKVARKIWTCLFDSNRKIPPNFYQWDAKMRSRVNCLNDAGSFTEHFSFAIQRREAFCTTLIKTNYDCYFYWRQGLNIADELNHRSH